MRRITIFALLLTTACNTQSGSGGIVSWQPVFTQDQSWRAGGEFSAPDGSRSCVVTSGEIRITLTSFNSKIIEEVATTLDVNPGDVYDIIVKNHTYETASGTYSAADSKAIIKDFLANPMVYTELHVPTVEENKGLRNNTNKISLDGFADQYASCKTFIGSK